ncbi:MAG: hypothetical protein OEQ29_02655 [Alphaproteobacteria bacterium]|nr:hypothetical protein [Alphaproteobacteria bacterium]
MSVSTALGIGAAVILVISPAWTGKSGTAGAVEFKPLVEFQSLRYTPKMTPDTVLDYRPRIARQFKRLPPRSIKSLPELFRTFQQMKAATAKRRGRWVAGMTNLGANAREYRPTDAELLLAVVGNRIRSLVRRGSLGEITSVLARTGIKTGQISYHQFDFRHADVMGAGRYFYASAPRQVTVLLRPR